MCGVYRNHLVSLLTELGATAYEKERWGGAESGAGGCQGKSGGGPAVPAFMATSSIHTLIHPTCTFKDRTKTEPQSFPIIQFDTSNPPAFPTHSLTHSLTRPSTLPKHQTFHLTHNGRSSSSPYRCGVDGAPSQTRHLLRRYVHPPTHSLALRETVNQR